MPYRSPALPCANQQTAKPTIEHAALPPGLAAQGVCLGCRSACCPGESGVLSQMGVALIVLDCTGDCGSGCSGPWRFLTIPGEPGGVPSQHRSANGARCLPAMRSLTCGAAPLGMTELLDVVVVLPAKPRHAGCGLIPLPRRHVQSRRAHDHILGAHQRAILPSCPASGQRRGTF
jgi:hypothetical protein